MRERVPELRLLADHDATCPAVVPLGLAPGSPVASVYAVAHHMAARGWNLPTGQRPACVSVLLAYQHAGPLLDALLAALRSLGSTLSEDKSSTAAEVWQEVQKLAKADHAAAKAVVADARAQAGTEVTMGEKAVRLALKKGEAFSREDSKPPKYQLHE